MKKGFKIALAIVFVVIIALGAHLFWLSNLNGAEKFPNDTLLANASNKTALVIVAHDDDAIGCAGTITKLTKKGWKVHYLTFYGNWRKDDNPIRKKEAELAGQIQNLASIQLVDFSIQRSDTVKE